MSPFVWAPAAAIVVGFGVAAYILRWEFRHQLRQHRYGGFVVGGDR